MHIFIYVCMGIHKKLQIPANCVGVSPILLLGSPPMTAGVWKTM